MGNNVYTVLAFSAFLALAFGVGFVWYKYNEHFGTWNPFGAI